MAEAKFVLNGLTVEEVQTQVDFLWRDLRDPSTDAYIQAALFLREQGIDKSPQEFLSESRATDMSVGLDEEHFEPGTLAVVAVTWIGGKLLDKAFDKFWDKFVEPRLAQMFGEGAVAPAPADPPPRT